jgi:putative ATP-binding cassette transporter
VKNLGKTLATVWRIAVPYFRSEDKLAGLVLLATVIGIELATVAINVLLNQWNSRFYNALQERNWDVFVYELKYFSVLAAVYIAFAVYQLYLNQWLQIRWRTWMTRRYLEGWLHDANHYRMQLLGDAADNPDQRIADDVRLFVEQTLSIGIGFSIPLSRWARSSSSCGGCRLPRPCTSSACSTTFRVIWSGAH